MVHCLKPLDTLGGSSVMMLKTRYGKREEGDQRHPQRTRRLDQMVKAIGKFLILLDFF